MAVDADTAEPVVAPPSDPDVAQPDGAKRSPNGGSTTTETDSPVRSPLKVALGVGLVAIVAIGGVAGWLGFQLYQDHRTDLLNREFVEVARQGAVNLTTIDYREVDTDVKRILDSAAGSFYDDFNNRSQPFVEVVKQAKSKSAGTVADAGLESRTDSEAKVLVAVNVKTTMADGPPQAPRSWRMRISVQKIDGDFKVSNVEFVP